MRLASLGTAVRALWLCERSAVTSWIDLNRSAVSYPIASHEMDKKSGVKFNTLVIRR